MLTEEFEVYYSKLKQFHNEEKKAEENLWQFYKDIESEEIRCEFCARFKSPEIGELILSCPYGLSRSNCYPDCFVEKAE